MSSVSTDTSLPVRVALIIELAVAQRSRICGLSWHCRYILAGFIMLDSRQHDCPLGCSLSRLDFAIRVDCVISSCRLEKHHKQRRCLKACRLPVILSQKRLWKRGPHVKRQQQQWQQMRMQSW